MQIKTIIIQGDDGDVEIHAADYGAQVIANDVLAEVARTDSREDRFAVAFNAAKVIYGTTKRGEPNATNSMIHDVLREIERVAGC